MGDVEIDLLLERWPQIVSYDSGVRKVFGHKPNQAEMLEFFESFVMDPERAPGGIR